MKRILLLAVAAVVALVCARGAVAQTSLVVNTHWADGAKCGCTVQVIQNNADGSQLQIFRGVTDDTGHLAGSVTLDVQGVYTLKIFSNAYGIPVWSLPFSTGLVAPLVLQSATLNLVFTRPSVNGQPIPCCTVPVNYTPPTLATGTNVAFGI
jgi:hypothetical protein